MFTFSELAQERSTYVIPLSFVDETGASIVPSSASWTLSTPDGRIINNRKSVSITPLASTVKVVLSGADLAVADPLDTERIFLALAKYTSALGTNLPIANQCRFYIQPVLGAESRALSCAVVSVSTSADIVTETA